MESSYAAIIAQYVESVADWRRRRAQEEPWETRHLNAASRLDALVGYIQTLPADDERFETLGKLNREGEIFVPGPILANAVARFSVRSTVGAVGGSASGSGSPL